MIQTLLNVLSCDAQADSSGLRCARSRNDKRAEESSCGTDSKVARASRPHYIAKNSDLHRASPTQFAVTSKSTVLEVIPPVWT